MGVKWRRYVCVRNDDVEVDASLCPQLDSEGTCTYSVSLPGRRNALASITRRTRKRGRVLFRSKSLISIKRVLMNAPICSPFIVVYLFLMQGRCARRRRVASRVLETAC